MKKRFGREIIWMLLPVVVLGGVGWWRSSGGGLSMLQAAPANLRSGAVRLEVGSWTDAKPLPAEVARGYVVKKQVSLWQGGQAPVSEVAPFEGHELSSAENVRLVFRRRAKWHILKPRERENRVKFPEKTLDLKTFAARRDLQCLINLQDVPRDADEVRLRGEWVHSNVYYGATCGTARPDPRWSFNGTSDCKFVTRSKPFDVLVKAAKSAWPAPVVSRETKVEVLGAARLRSNRENLFVLHLRHREKRNWEAEPFASVRQMRILNGNGREVLLFDNYIDGSWRNFNDSGSLNQRLFYPNKPGNELFARFITTNAAPKGGWNSLKRPLWLEGEVDDGECWPTKFKVRIDESLQNPKLFGAPK